MRLLEASERYYGYSFSRGSPPIIEVCTTLNTWLQDLSCLVGQLMLIDRTPTVHDEKSDEMFVSQFGARFKIAVPRLMRDFGEDLFSDEF